MQFSLKINLKNAASKQRNNGFLTKKIGGSWQCPLVQCEKDNPDKHHSIQYEYFGDFLQCSLLN